MAWTVGSICAKVESLFARNFERGGRTAGCILPELEHFFVKWLRIGLSRSSARPIRRPRYAGDVATLAGPLLLRESYVEMEHNLEEPGQRPRVAGPWVHRCSHSCRLHKVSIMLLLLVLERRATVRSSSRVVTCVRPCGHCGRITPGASVPGSQVGLAGLMWSCIESVALGARGGAPPPHDPEQAFVWGRRRRLAFWLQRSHRFRGSRRAHGHPYCGFIPGRVVALVGT
jgi:hypothetical protein